jgi:8-oxo-dGTP pyrophosphatase MutT (NUDIX family)
MTRAITNATIRSAATVMLVRDAPDLEVFVLRRTAQAVFGPGATVFPGGAVDPADAAAVSRVVGADETAASTELGLAEGGLARRVAAVRECLEEAGILLARSEQDHAFAAPRAEWRDALNAGHATLAQVLEAERLVIDARDLRVFAHWLTPLGAPRRYDTWFFVARAPEGQDGAHDDSELVASEWVRPTDALRRHEHGEIELILPTMRSLAALARFRSVDALFAALDAVPRDEQERPLVVADASGERVLLPGDEPRRATSWTIPLPDIDVREETRIVAAGGSH